ncbi:MAG: nitroreductase family deazaflavin-dependent oxidoreductase [Ktedonobacterales bacterium]|nr:nitroreductase family deazaflavin-dependent oxidoreductase [Ktedonobacterales bacterium]
MTTPTPTAPRQPPKLANRLLGAALHLPFTTPLSRAILLLTFTGRKSGKRFTTPVGYQRMGEVVTLFTDHDWYKNLQAQPKVTLLLAGKTLHGTATVTHGQPDVIDPALWDFVQASPAAARAYGVSRTANGQLDRASATAAAARFTLIRVQLVS